jgi:hypothetical protein
MHSYVFVALVLYSVCHSPLACQHISANQRLMLQMVKWRCLGPSSFTYLSTLIGFVVFHVSALLSDSPVSR